jgi:hypothetical protein
LRLMNEFCTVTTDYHQMRYYLVFLSIKKENVICRLILITTFYSNKNPYD